MSKLTITDVAKYAKVSIATVSRVINDVPNVKPDFRERVQKAIKELDFKPNQLARGLKNDITHTIGVIISDIGDPIFTSIIRKIEECVSDFGYTMIIVSSDNSPEKENKYIKIMQEKRVDGIIISSTGKNEDYLYSIKNSGIPVVLLDRKPMRLKFDAVYMDKRKAIYDLANLLINKGHRKIVLATGQKEMPTNFDRYIGCVQAHYAANLPFDESLVMYGDFSEEHGRNVLEKVMKQVDKPTAIISVGVKITSGILLEANKMHIKIPDDLSLVSYGNIDLGDLIDPLLTHVEPLTEKIGMLVGDTIIKRMLNPFNDSVEEIVLEVGITEGKSVREFSLIDEGSKMMCLD